MKLTCIGCGEEFDESDYGFRADDGPVCGGCLQDDAGTGNVIHRIGPLGHEELRVGRWETSDESLQDEFLGIFGRPEWKKTDAWRGYFAFPGQPDGFTQVASGWVTNCIDESMKYKILIGEIFAEMKKDVKDLDFTTYWTFSETSNVFSLSVDVWVDDVGKFTKYLLNRTPSTTLEEFGEAFV